jgi:PAS domain S-box-containing protein
MKPVIVQNILESMSIGLMVIDDQGEIIATNEAAASSLGYGQEVLRSKGWAELFFEREENEDFNQVIIDVIMMQTINLHQKVPYVKPNGQEVQLAITTSYLRDNQDTIGIVMLFDDITELHRLHENEKRSLEERNRLQQERVEGLNHFATSVAHQIRNPLMSMGGFANRLLKNIDKDQRQMAYLEPILSGIKRLEDIVGAVEDYTSISHLERTSVLIDEIVDQVRSDLDIRAAALNKRIDWSIQLSVKEVSLDCPSFVQALTELLLNALESFTGQEGHMEIVAKKEDGSMIFEISDSGPGIKEEDQSFIFDPFFTTKAVGVGMGLCKAQRIISEHEGRIHIKSAPGMGTKVTIELPEKDHALDFGAILGSSRPG